ncbi:hypothetical protein [Actinotalea sp. JY-7885]|uniref:hypothetical protein n=1 Tax=Actinotalea sp. JY-7885 TaxID=2758576 RepID=UPI00165DC97D|nr:hypothetical protein [Actinotalea sp. JY-7885]
MSNSVALDECGTSGASSRSREAKAVHVWMPDRRSLCDRRASTPGRLEEKTDEEFDGWLAEQRDAPVCGSCLLLVSRLRRQASAILQQAAGRVWPERPTQAWAQLRDTRWAGEVDLEVFLSRDDLDQRIKFDAVNYEVDRGSVQSLVDERDRYFADLVRWRAERRAEDPISD